MKKVLGLLIVLVVAPFAQAADIEAGKAKVATVCAACLGANGVSVTDAIPNLAAQRAGYLESQLKALKEGARKNPIKNAIASQLSAEDIANVAAYFAVQPGAAASAKPTFLPNLAKTGVTFPEGYKDTYYAIFTTDKQHRPGVNQAECLACQKPLDNTSYTFTLKQLAETK